MRLIALILWLTFFSGVATGFFLDRWLHRPISSADGSISVQVQSRTEGQAPIPCYSDKSENCPSDPGPLNESPRGANPTREDRPANRPISRPCWYEPLLNVKCQERT